MIAGVASFLAEQRIGVVQTGASLPVVSDVDVVLYDTFGQLDGEDLNLADFVAGSGAKVVISSDGRPHSIRTAHAGWSQACLAVVRPLTGPARAGASRGARCADRWQLGCDGRAVLAAAPGAGP